MSFGKKVVKFGFEVGWFGKINKYIYVVLCGLVFLVLKFLVMVLEFL